MQLRPMLLRPLLMLLLLLLRCIAAIVAGKLHLLHVAKLLSVAHELPGFRRRIDVS